MNKRLINMKHIFIRIIFITQSKHQIMASSSIFGCCNGSETINASQVSVFSVSRNLAPHSNRNTIITPKASLKNLSNIRSLKNLQSINRANFKSQDVLQKKTPEYQYYSPLQTSKKIQLGYTPLSTHRRRQTYFSPNQRITQPVQNCYREKIKFFYNQTEKMKGNSENIMMTSKDKTKGQQLTQTKFSRENDVNPNETAIKQDKSQLNQLKQSKKEQQLKSLVDSNQLSYIAQLKSNRLGGSIFTVISQDSLSEIQLQSSLRLQQSTIIINVFHPTESQLQKWNTEKQIEFTIKSRHK